MYTPYLATVKNIASHDRPFAAYLFVSYKNQIVYKKNQLLSNKIQLGVIGKHAQGKALQDFVHDIYGFVKADGWDYQIKDALGVNFYSEYTTHLYGKEKGYFDTQWNVKASLGTVYTNIETGITARIGTLPLQTITNSIAYNTHLNGELQDTKNIKEAFFYINPTIQYTLYDATIEGSFLNKGSEVTKEIVPVTFRLQLGFKCTLQRFNVGYIYSFHTSKVQNLRYPNGNSYGSIQLNYLFR